MELLIVGLVIGSVANLAALVITGVIYKRQTKQLRNAMEEYNAATVQLKNAALAQKYMDLVYNNNSEAPVKRTIN